MYLYIYLFIYFYTYTYTYIYIYIYLSRTLRKYFTRDRVIISFRYNYVFH